MGRATWDQIRAGIAAHEPARVVEPVGHRAAVAMILRDGPEGIEVLFIRRSEHPDDPWSGQMAFPGGRAESGDTTLQVTAVRETAEEIGVDLARSGERLGALDEVRAMARMRPMDLTIQPFVFRLLEPVEATPGPEVRSVHWLPLDELAGERWRSTMEYAYRDTRLQFPCLRLQGLVIWGLTYRMFSNLLALLPEPGTAADAPR